MNVDVVPGNSWESRLQGRGGGGGGAERRLVGRFGQIKRVLQYLLEGIILHRMAEPARGFLFT